MPNITAKLLAVLVMCALLNVLPVAAQRQGQSFIRGTIENVNGNNLTVAVRDGSTQKIAMANDLVVTGLVKTTLAGVKPGSYTRHGIEIRISPVDWRAEHANKT
jgi:hypothetical protein